MKVRIPQIKRKSKFNISIKYIKFPGIRILIEGIALIFTRFMNIDSLPSKQRKSDHLNSCKGHNIPLNYLKICRAQGWFLQFMGLTTYLRHEEHHSHPTTITERLEIHQL